MTFEHGFLIFYAALSLYNCGIAWQAQRVSYPLFGMVPADGYIAYHRFYSRSIPLVVIVPGFACFFAPLVLLVARPDTVPLWAALLNVVLGLTSLVVTVALEIPRHTRLENDGKSEPVIRQLIRYNWPRTLAISGQGMLALWMLTLAFAPVGS